MVDHWVRNARSPLTSRSDTSVDTARWRKWPICNTSEHFSGTLQFMLLAWLFCCTLTVFRPLCGGGIFLPAILGHLTLRRPLFIGYCRVFRHGRLFKKQVEDCSEFEEQSLNPEDRAFGASGPRFTREYAPSTHYPPSCPQSVSGPSSNKSRVPLAFARQSPKSGLNIAFLRLHFRH